MSDSWETALERWRSAGLLDAQTAESISAFERERDGNQGPGRLAIIAFGLGSLLLVAGILLFVASNWQQLSPGVRFLLLIAGVAVFHVSGAFASGSHPALATALHAAGTGALGGAIFISGQTFNLAENWPDGFLLWAIGAAAGLWLLRDWPHVLYTAVLGPVWVFSKMLALSGFDQARELLVPTASFALLLAVVYLFAPSAQDKPVWRAALSRLGAAAFIPSAIVLGAVSSEPFSETSADGGGTLAMFAWALAFLLPAGLAYLLRGADSLLVAPAAAGVIAIALLDPSEDPQFLAMLLIYALGSVGIVLWGLRDRVRLPVNLGIIGFALSVLVFYFASDLFTKLGRSMGLIGAGLLFLGGGLALEKTRRSIITRIDQAPS